MLSAELDTEFSNNTNDKVKYGNIKKVYSIWICTEVAQYKANTIERYNIQRSVYPKEKEPVITSRYDLMEAVIVNISKKHDDEDSDSKLIQMLTDLFDDSISGIDKVHILQEEYGIPTTEEFEKEVADMTAYAAGILAKGESIGASKGETRLAKLMLILFDEKLYEDAKKASEDEQYRHQLFEKYKIE